VAVLLINAILVAIFAPVSAYESSNAFLISWYLCVLRIILAYDIHEET
jgi:hypothetical protein